MRAIIILYEGPELSGNIVSEFVARMQGVTSEVTVCQLSDNEVNDALLKATQSVHVETKAKSELAKAIEHATTYIEEKVLSFCSDPTFVAYAIGRFISSGDVAMKNAVEILAKNRKKISNKKFTRPIVDVIAAIYENQW